MRSICYNVFCHFKAGSVSRSTGRLKSLDLSKETLAALTVMGRKIKMISRQEKDIFVSLGVVRIP